ncbi:MAG: PIN domain-containing protein [Anaerolineae bacterium]|nr:PIN domain-containing protein [Anaerolineae bacterium]
MTALIDTSFLLASAASNDANYAVAQRVVLKIGELIVLPVPVMPELFYMVSVRVGYKAALHTFQYLDNAGFQIEPLTPDDRIRMREIMNKYVDAEFDFVDTAIMALSERLNITRVYTFDRRDFSIFRPRHTSHLDLLP